MKNQIFSPTVAKFKGDIQTSWDLQQPLVDAEYSRGLMLVIPGGIKGVTEDAEKQYNNLKDFGEIYGDAPVMTMLSNIPIEQMDFLNHSEFARTHVKTGVNFASKLPIGKRKIVTFHLDSLVSEEEFNSKNEIEWKNDFHNVIKPSLKEVARYASNKGVELKIETVPVPEFGDVSDKDERTYRGVKLHELRNPFYLTHQWGFEQIKELGLGICLDLCHNRTLYEIANTEDNEKVLHKSDKIFLKNKNLFDDVKKLESSDLIHLNDGAGIYSRNEDGTVASVFYEGVALGHGDIKNLREIVNYLNSNKIPWVLEVNEEGDFNNRPGSKKSIEWLLKDK